MEEEHPDEDILWYASRCLQQTVKRPDAATCSQRFGILQFYSGRRSLDRTHQKRYLSSKSVNSCLITVGLNLPPSKETNETRKIRRPLLVFRAPAHLLLPDRRHGHDPNALALPEHVLDLFRKLFSFVSAGRQVQVVLGLALSSQQGKRAIFAHVPH